jgi:NADH-quinone oxidoreductase subunit C
MINHIESQLKSRFPSSILNISSEGRRLSLVVKKEEVYRILSHLKDTGFNHFSDVTVVDYIGENEFELIYHLWSHGENTRAIVKVRIPREDPTVKSVVELWTGAQMHERENHELFGINFEGNPNLSPLFLEDWEEIPPFRKDFDSRKYVKENYYREEEGYPLAKG